MEVTVVAIVSNTQNSPESTTKVLIPTVGKGNPLSQPGIPGLYTGTDNKSIQAPNN